MLIIARKKNESILIGNDIKIVVTEIKGSKVRFGIKAPPNTPVLRGEIVDGKEEGESGSDR